MYESKLFDLFIQQQFETKSKQLQQQYDDDMKKVDPEHQVSIFLKTLIYSIK